MVAPELAAFVSRMPKVELHIHLEGAVAPQTLLRLAERNHVELPARDIAGVEQMFRYKHFSDFLSAFMAFARAFVRGEDFELMGYELACDAAAQQIRYIEVMISPAQYLLRGLDLHEIVQGTLAGFQRAQRELGVLVGLTLDCGRQFGIEVGWRALEVAKAYAGHGLVGWSIGGQEIGYPPEPFGELFQAARAAGLRLAAHAGEVVGPPSVWGALNALHVERIGHGIRSIEAPALVEALRARQVMLDVSPTSNVRTGAVPGIDVHPLRQLYDAGVRVSINTDDPTFFSTTLTREYMLVIEQFGFTAAELCAMVLDAARASFLPEAERTWLVQRLADELAVLRSEYAV